ncbi:MAG: TerB family tellurite resistance protein [Acidobacteria bacterium]|nr:TerB family tellurite resistance protein [Acidobacteriota bacterium]MBU4253313.1 TerB family tellurite resistance protein [Acidobacteriota bacterium]MBU4329533.1 TerB family tellurite resistance protein [Acidobacteriota bacterium]MCG2816256.1 TerB family tellurite resistance protein [Candidatus Aminicenantes bacterium]
MRKFLKNLLRPKSMEVEPSEENRRERLQIATCVLLLEAVHSDDEFSSIESGPDRLPAVSGRANRPAASAPIMVSSDIDLSFPTI